MIKRIPDSLFAKFSKVQPVALYPDEYSVEQPLSFHVYYLKNKQKEVVDTIYLEDGNPKLDLYLEVLNESSEKSEFKSPSAAGLQTAPSGEEEYAHFNRCHFYIQLEKQIQIKLEEISIEPKEQWQVNYDEKNNFITIYFLHKTGLVLQSSNSPNGFDKVLLTFKNLAAHNPTIKTTNLNFFYDYSQPGEDGESGTLNPVRIAETEVPEEDRIETPYPISVKTPISITHHPDKNNILLQWRFIGSNAIINDGTTVNELNLKIFNRSLLNYNRPNLLLDKMNSKFIVSFETGDKSETITTLDQAKEISITTTDSHNWKINRTQNAAEWIIQLNNASNKDKLTAGEGIELNIKNLVTSKASGVGYLYITYQNIGDYPDGQLVVPIEKTPLLYRGAQVGVGTNSPSAKLEINGGDIKITSDDKGILFAGGAKIYKKSGSGLKIQPHNDGHGIEFTKADGTTNVMLLKDGKVGMGTNNPSAKLEINSGDIKIASENHGILFAEGAKIYKKNGSGLKIQPHHDSHGIEFTKADGQTNVMIIKDGKVGIGTKNPMSNLSISNNYNAKTNEAGVLGEISFVGYDRKYPSASIKAQSPSWDDQSHLIFMTSSDGTAPKERMRITNNGNIGIGIADPGNYKFNVNGGDTRLGGKLDVEGEIKSKKYQFVASNKYGGQNISNSVRDHIIKFLKFDDPFNVFDEENSRFKCPVSGYYFFTATITLGSGNDIGDGVILGFSHNKEEKLGNGMTFVLDPGKIKDRITQTITAIMNLTKGDFVDIRLWGVDYCSFTVGVSSFMGQMISSK